MLPVTEPIPIGDWLSSYKLGDYTHLFEASGYDRTDFLLSLTSDELVEIGVQKPGHKKKIMSAVSSLIHKEHLIATKPVSGEHNKYMKNSVGLSSTTYPKPWRNPFALPACSGKPMSAQQKADT